MKIDVMDVRDIQIGDYDYPLHEERIAVHPASGKKLLVPPRIFLAFKSSAALKNRLNHGK